MKPQTGEQKEPGEFLLTAGSFWKGFFMFALQSFFHFPIEWIFKGCSSIPYC